MTWWEYAICIFAILDLYGIAYALDSYHKRHQ